MAESSLHALDNPLAVDIPEYSQRYVIGYDQSAIKIHDIFPGKTPHRLLRSHQIITIRVLNEVMLAKKSGNLPLPTLVDPFDGKQRIFPLFLDLIFGKGRVHDHVREDLQALFEILLEDRYTHVIRVPPRTGFDASPQLLHLLGDLVLRTSLRTLR